MILKFNDFVGCSINEKKLIPNTQLKHLSKHAMHNISEYSGIDEYCLIEIDNKTAIVKISAIENEKLSACKENVTLYIFMQNNKPVAMYCDETCIDYKELSIDKFEYITDTKELELCKQIFDDIKEEHKKINKLIILLNY